MNRMVNIWCTKTPHKPFRHQSTFLTSITYNPGIRHFIRNLSTILQMNLGDRKRRQHLRQPRKYKTRWVIITEMESYGILAMKPLYPLFYFRPCQRISKSLFISKCLANGVSILVVYITVTKKIRNYIKIHSLRFCSCALVFRANQSAITHGSI